MESETSKKCRVVSATARPRDSTNRQAANSEHSQTHLQKMGEAWLEAKCIHYTKVHWGMNNPSEGGLTTSIDKKVASKEQSQIHLQKMIEASIRGKNPE
jgi:hypothetical protein